LPAADAERMVPSKGDRLGVIAEAALGSTKDHVAARGSFFGLGRCMSPFHIKAQDLRQSQLEPATAFQVFEPRTDKGVQASSEIEAGSRERWRQSDVKRLVAAAEQAGLQSYRVEIAPDGTLSIIVGAP
jgi:hypothetical protein